MKLKAFSKLNSEDRELNKVQQNTESALGTLSRNPLANGILISDLVLISGNNVIENKLLRKPQGYLIVKASAAANFYDNINAAADPELRFNLNSSAPCTVSIWLF